MPNAHYPDAVRACLKALDELRAEVTDSHRDAYNIDNSTQLGTAVGTLVAALGAAFPTVETIAGNGASVFTAATDVITEAAHGLAVDDYVRLQITSGATGATAGYYYVKTVPDSSNFTLSATKGGSQLLISADGVVNVYKVTGNLAGGVGARILEGMAANVAPLASSGAISLAFAAY